MIVGKKITGFFELVKPLVEFKFEIIQSRGNNVFELATQEEIDKLGSTTKGSSSKGQFTDDIDLDEVKLILVLQPQSCYLKKCSSNFPFDI